MRHNVVLRVGLLICLSESSILPLDVQLPGKSNSVRFVVIGDHGTGGRGQYELAAQMAKFHAEWPFTFVITAGDNIYGFDTASNLRKKFELPYKPLLDRGVTFHASLGNHDSPGQVHYKPFNMDGQRYYSLRKGNVELFALDSNRMDMDQEAWLTRSLKASSAPWKICYFHHPLYSDGAFHGPSLELRKRIEPILQNGHVQVVFSGHDHVYQRLLPQKQIQYFVIGNSGQLRRGNLRRSTDSAMGFDSDLAFVAVEVVDDKLHFQVISRTGTTVDSGIITRSP